MRRNWHRSHMSTQLFERLTKKCKQAKTILRLPLWKSTLPCFCSCVKCQFSSGMWYFHDGASPRYASREWEKLNNNFLERWIGRSGSVLWASHSPESNVSKKMPRTIRQTFKIFNRMRDSIIHGVHACITSFWINFVYI